MQPESIKKKLIEELTGRNPDHKVGMLFGFVFSMGIVFCLGAVGYVWLAMQGMGDPSGSGALLAGVVAILVGIALGGIGSKLGWLDAEMDQSAYAALNDDRGVLDHFGMDYSRDRAEEAAAAGMALATFQFLFGSLWSCAVYLFAPNNLPEDGIRAATAVVMYLQKSGRISQAKLTQGLSASGLPEQDTRRGLAFLVTTGFVVGNSEGFLLSEKGRKILVTEA